MVVSFGCGSCTFQMVRTKRDGINSRAVSSKKLLMLDSWCCSADFDAST